MLKESLRLCLSLLVWHGVGASPELVLVDATSGQSIQTLYNHTQLQLDTNLDYTIRVDGLLVEDASVPFCLFILDDNIKRIEPDPPFYLAGRGTNHNELYASHTLKQPGWHTIYVAPHTSGVLPKVVSDPVKDSLYLVFHVAVDDSDEQQPEGIQADSSSTNLQEDAVATKKTATVQGSIYYENTSTDIYFAGPPASPSATTDPNPYQVSSVFGDYRLDLTSSDGTSVYHGYYMGSMESDAGNVWKVHLPVNVSGTFTVHFRSGVNIAMSSGNGESAGFMDGADIIIPKRNNVFIDQTMEDTKPPPLYNTGNLFEYPTDTLQESLRQWQLLGAKAISATITNEVYLNSDSQLHYNLSVWDAWQARVAKANAFGFIVYVQPMEKFDSVESKVLLRRELLARFSHMNVVLLDSTPSTN